jgi:hypothetical protein
MSEWAKVAALFYRVAILDIAKERFTVHQRTVWFKSTTVAHVFRFAIANKRPCADATRWTGTLYTLWDEGVRRGWFKAVEFPKNLRLSKTVEAMSREFRKQQLALVDTDEFTAALSLRRIAEAGERRRRVQQSALKRRYATFCQKELREATDGIIYHDNDVEVGDDEGRGEFFFPRDMQLTRWLATLDTDEERRLFFVKFPPPVAYTPDMEDTSSGRRLTLLGRLQLRTFMALERNKHDVATAAGRGVGPGGDGYFPAAPAWDVAGVPPIRLPDHDFFRCSSAFRATTLSTALPALAVAYATQGLVLPSAVFTDGVEVWGV